MPYYPDQHQRRSIRIPGCDYSNACASFSGLSVRLERAIRHRIIRRGSPVWLPAASDALTFGNDRQACRGGSRVDIDVRKGWAATQGCPYPGIHEIS